jgi:hypothetical protein
MDLYMDVWPSEYPVARTVFKQGRFLYVSGGDSIMYGEIKTRSSDKCGDVKFKANCTDNPHHPELAIHLERTMANIYMSITSKQSCGVQTSVPVGKSAVLAVIAKHYVKSISVCCMNTL